MTRDIRRTERHERDGDWGEGPWQNEPDLVEWRNDDYPGLALLVVRSPTGALCGYVGLPPGHPLHGQSWDDVDADVHGGLTYSGECAGHICHVPAPGEPDAVWWLGFDCGHAFDVMPATDALIRALGGALGEKYIERRALFDVGAGYRPLEYVMVEVERLAEQVKT